jgi:hypothetical protein
MLRVGFVPAALLQRAREHSEATRIVLIALQIDRNLLFDYKDLISNPKTCFKILRRICSSNYYHPGPSSWPSHASYIEWLALRQS